MATITKPRRAAEYIPTPEQIAEACAEIHQRRLAAFDDDSPVDEKKLKARLRSRRRLAATKAAANLELQQTDETVTEPADLDEHRDPRQVEQWIPVPTVDEPKSIGRQPAAQRHRNEFYTRFFPNWAKLTTRHERAARNEALQRRRERPYHGPQTVPTWTIEASFGDRTARQRIDDELQALGVIRGAAAEIATMPCYLALQRRILARYLWGMKREGRKVPRNRPTNWGFKLANQLMQEIEEGEPIDLDDCCPAAVQRVAADACRVRVKRDVIPFRAKRR
ncbi:hypothetical protein [Lacipirellula parvula]|uniref:Uncharacterized protein n=1 Tax=Lacipirellula parvula TaxID=2650471 RepID=A0A5K7XNK5_9BACT|nr:hypothetical protein [Lacipirellula parvula]BBO34749.1 hypothetical protein PLANPX_4361 [Lacipirellula parvula]